MCCAPTAKCGWNKGTTTALKAAHTSLKTFQDTAEYCQIRHDLVHLFDTTLNKMKMRISLKTGPFLCCAIVDYWDAGKSLECGAAQQSLCNRKCMLEATFAKMSFIFGNYHFVWVALNLHKGWYTACKCGSTCRQIQSKEDVREWRDLFSIQWHAVHWCVCVCVCKRQAPQSPSSGLSVVGWIWYTVKCVPLLKRTLRIMWPL